MKRLVITLTAGLAMLALGACGKQETKPQEGVTPDNAVQQQVQPADEQKPEEKPSAQADQYNGMAQAKVEDSSSEQDSDSNGQS